MTTAEEDKIPTEREQTDESLDLERQTADDELASRREAIDEATDAAIEQERERADDLREEVREGVPAAEFAETGRVIREERDEADERLSDERDEMAAALPSARGETDRRLASERGLADGQVVARDTLLGVVSHDVRGMLHIVVGHAALLSKEGARLENPTVSGHAERIQRAGKRMERLVGNLLDLACIEQGALAVTLAAGDIGLVVAEAVENVQPQALDGGISVTSDAETNLPVVEFDSLRVLQVLTNLLNNALKFTSRGGAVTVHTKATEDGVCISVSDTGIGIRSSDLALIFTRFVQVNKDDRRGVGLGLYISQSIVHGHGGRLWAESTFGEGASFHFTLPAHA